MIGLPMTSTASGSGTPDLFYKDFADGKYDSILKDMVKAWANNGFDIRNCCRSRSGSPTPDASMIVPTTADCRKTVQLGHVIQRLLMFHANSSGARTIRGAGSSMQVDECSV